MTFLGKLLVFLNAILATALLSWSLSLYTNRVDWPTVEADGKKLTEWPAVYAKESAAQNAAYADARTAVATSEMELASRKKALQDQLDLARSGEFYDLDRPGVKLTRDKAKQTKVAKKDGTSVLLRGLEVLQKELQQTVDATLGTEEAGKESGRKGLAAVRRQLAALDADVARFNGGIERFRVALAQREDEKRYLEDNRVNWDAQLITLQKRNDQLVERLKAFGVTRPAVLAPAPAGTAVAGPR